MSKSLHATNKSPATYGATLRNPSALQTAYSRTHPIAITQQRVLARAC